MPIYAYKCMECGHDEDVLQKISDPPLTACPACGQPSMAKQVTAAGFQLKGSGWYATDFRNKDGKGGPGAKPDSKAESANDDKGTKPDSAPAPAASAAATTPPAAGTHTCGSGGCGSCS